MAPLRCTAKLDPFLSLDCARVEGVEAQSKERKDQILPSGNTGQHGRPGGYAHDGVIRGEHAGSPRGLGGAAGDEGKVHGAVPEHGQGEDGVLGGRAGEEHTGAESAAAADTCSSLVSEQRST